MCRPGYAPTELPGFTLSYDTDIFIVGGGPAGLATAIAARQRGLSVIVADAAEPPVDKACGEGLLPDGLAALQLLGVQVDAGDGYLLNGIRFLDAFGEVAARFPSGNGLGVRRITLHQKMLERAHAAGVGMMWDSCVTAMAPEGVVVDGEILRARWIVGADGSGSRVRHWSGLDAGVRRQRVAFRQHYLVPPWSAYTEVYWGDERQAYVTPVGQEQVCVAAIGGARGGRITEVLGSFPSLARRLEGATPAAAERGAVTAMHRLKRVWRGNVALIGDASGGVDAITGEGLALSFHQSLALAEALATGNMPAYQRAHRKLSHRPAVMGRLLLLLDKYPHLRGRVFKSFVRNPPLFSRLVAVHVGEATPSEMATAGATLGWRLLRNA